MKLARMKFYLDRWVINELYLIKKITSRIPGTIYLQSCKG